MAVQTQIQTRRGTAATWTSTNPTLAAGEIGFESDTNKFKIGTGSTAWTALAYAANTSPLTTKGDLYTYSTTNDRLAVGNNGETLVADSSTSTGLRYQSAYNGNVLINGGFDFFQRGTSSSASGWTCADRWYNIVGGTTTFSQDTSVPTAAGVQYSYKWTTGASSSYGQFYTALDSATVKPLRGQAMAFSFWVKATGTAFSGVLNADAAYSNSTDAYASQTTSVTITGGTNITPTSTWTRYTGTLTIPSDAVGLKIGLVPTSVQASGVVVYLAAVQLELGSVATTFKRSGGTIQGELAACKYYYSRYTSGNVYGVLSTGIASNTGTLQVMFPFPTGMRVVPTAVDTSAMATFYFEGGASNGNTPTTVTIGTNGSVTCGHLLVNKAAAFVSGMPYSLNGNNSATAFIGFSSEL